MFTSFLSQTPEVYQIIVVGLIALAMGLVFAFLYAFFKKKDGYYKDMVIAFSLFPFLVTMALIGVTLLTAQISSDELTARFGRVAVALLSAVLILRFRSEQRNFEDLTYMFFLTIIGMILGCGYLLFALLVYAVVLVVFAVFSLLGLPKQDKNTLSCNITVPENLDYPNAFKEAFDTYCSSYQLVKVKSADLGSVFIVTYTLTLKDSAKQKEFLDAIRERNSNLNIVLTLGEFKAYK